MVRGLRIQAVSASAFCLPAATDAGRDRREWRDSAGLLGETKPERRKSSQSTNLKSHSVESCRVRAMCGTNIGSARGSGMAESGSHSQVGRRREHRSAASIRLAHGELKYQLRGL